MHCAPPLGRAARLKDLRQEVRDADPSDIAARLKDLRQEVEDADPTDIAARRMCLILVTLKASSMKITDRNPGHQSLSLNATIDQQGEGCIFLVSEN